MTDKDLISQIQLLREIKPRKDWVILTKQRTLEQERIVQEQISVTEAFSRVFFQFRPALIPVLVLMILVGTFGFAQISVPGDILYPVKRVGEKSQALFVPEEELPGYNLGKANKRLEELTKIAQSNQVKKLAPAISEFQANVSEAAENLKTVKDPNVKEIITEARKLEENKEKVESLGVAIGETEELDNALADLVEREIENLETGSLTEQQEELLERAKEDFEAGDYNQALEKILFLSNSSH
jgi:hypothetical protein